MRSIGLDIGDYSVKLVELIQNKKTIVINQTQERVLSRDTSPEDKELEVIEFIRDFAQQNDISQTRWILALKQDQVTTRYKDFPFSDKLKIQKSLPFEMEEDIPFDTDNCIFDAKVVETKGNTSHVLATAIPKSQIEKTMAFASNFGVEIYALSIEGLAFANLIEDWENPPPHSQNDLSLDADTAEKGDLQVVLNIGHKKTLFTAFENGRLVFTRSLYWGSQQIVQEIIKKQEISYVEALKLLQNNAYILLNKDNSSFEQTQLSNLITQSLKELVRDVQMTLFELKSEFHAEISSLHFTGGGSLIANLGAYLTQHIEVPCNPVQLLQRYAGENNSYNLESRFTVATAIALEGFKKHRNPPINLMKGIFAKQNDALKTFWHEWGSVSQVAIAALIILFVWTYTRDNFSLTLVEKGEDAVKIQAKQVAKLPNKQANENGVQKYIKEHKKRATELKKISQVAQMNSALDILKKISDTAPQRAQLKIDINSFHVKDDIVQLTGYASTQNDVNSLAQSLKGISIDGIVNNQSRQMPLVPKKVGFNFSFKADRGLSK